MRESGFVEGSVTSTWLQALPDQGLGQYMTNNERHSVLTMRLYVAFRPVDEDCEACAKLPIALAIMPLHAWDHTIYVATGTS